MVNLKGEKIYLRALESTDIDFLYELENNMSFWHLSDTQTPFSKFILKTYIDNSHLDIYEAKQLRLVICNLNDEPIGLVDLFDFDIRNRRAGIGIIIYNASDRNKGFGTEAIQLMLNYGFSHLQLHQIYANVLEDNSVSLKLFKSFGFEIVGLKKQWIKVGEIYKDQYLLQKIKS